MNTVPNPAYSKVFSRKYKIHTKAGEIFSSKNCNNSIPFFLYPNFEKYSKYAEPKLDLNKELTITPSDTFLIRVTGNSMINAGINTNDILVVDRSLKPENDKIVIAEVNKKLLVKRIRYNNGDTFLISENDGYPEIHITKDDKLNIWGVVTSVIKNVHSEN